MTTITIDDALADAGAAYARQSGMNLSALLESLLQEKLAALRAPFKLADSTPRASKSVFDMTPEEINAELGSAMRQMREYERAAANGENVPATLRLNITRSPSDGDDLLRLLHEIGEQAKANGTSEMTLEEINAEIAAARRERRERREREWGQKGA